MGKVLTFQVGIEGLENKIWRKVEITDGRTVADLAYTILATFNSLAYHLYDIKYKNKIYDCWINVEDDHRREKPINATITKLKDIGLEENDEMQMDYDYGTTTTFIIKYISSKELEKGHGRHYPYIIDGAGRGMIDDISGDELKEIVNDIDKKGYSNHHFTPGYETSMKYDYRDYDIECDNYLLKGEMEEIKYAFEVGE